MNRAGRIAVAVGAVGLAGAAVAVAAAGLGGSPTPASTTARALSTVPVIRATLTQTEQVSGVLDYGEPAPISASGSGVITWLPRPGTVVQRGQPVYKVDNEPVPLFYGELPLYRQLRPGITGDDVLEVERNLAALGFGDFAVDRRYTSATAAAVRRWQKGLGLTRTGVIAPADVVLAPRQLRVASRTVRPGSPAGGQVLTYTGTTRVVRIDLDVALQGLAKPGTAAKVTLPEGRTVDGVVAGVGSVATAGEEETNEPATIEATVTIADQSKLGTLDQAPVMVELVSTRVENVLTVPIGALVALAEGGYGVQVVTGSSSRYVPVRVGRFGNGRVQVTGVAEGTAVVVPS